MPPCYSFLDGIDEFLGKKNDFGVLWLSIARFVLFSKQLRLLLFVELQEVETHLVVDFQLEIDSSLVDDGRSFMNNVVVCYLMLHLGIFEETRQ